MKVKARQQTFVDQYFNHILALGLAVSATLVVMALFFVKPIAEQTVDVAVEVQNIEDTNAKTFTLPQEIIETPMPSSHSMPNSMQMNY